MVCRGTALKNLKEINHLRDLDVDDVRYDDVDWIHLAQDKIKWQGTVNTVIHFQVT
jgi:hypothetical protein